MVAGCTSCSRDAVAGDPVGTRRAEFDVRQRSFTDQRWTYRPDLAAATGADNHLVADAQALDPHRLGLVERDGGLGLNAWQGQFGPQTRPR